jgi:glycosyltransferase involved in cell wall biosynthesis
MSGDVLNKDMPLVSIGLPVYNREGLIAKTLDSLLAQTFKNFELVISDNLSTDKTGEICRKYAAQDSRIRYIRQEKNLGMLGNFNFVKQEAKGKYFLWTASDDMCEPQFVEALVEQLEKDPELALVMADLKYVSESGEFIKFNKLETIRVADVKNDWEKKRLTFFQYPGNKNWDCFYGLYRTEIVQKCHLPNKIRKNLVFSLEIPFLAQVAVRGKIASIDKPLKLYRYYPESSAAKEASELRFFDRFIRGMEIWSELVSIALSSSLSLYVKLQFLLKISLSASKYIISSLFVRQDRTV